MGHELALCGTLQTGICKGKGQSKTKQLRGDNVSAMDLEQNKSKLDISAST
jgi:hypothetical protein